MLTSIAFVCQVQGNCLSFAREAGSNDDLADCIIERDRNPFLVQVYADIFDVDRLRRRVVRRPVTAAASATEVSGDEIAW
jgi:hypothetical protein